MLVSLTSFSCDTLRLLLPHHKYVDTAPGLEFSLFGIACRQVGSEP